MDSDNVDAHVVTNDEQEITLRGVFIVDTVIGLVLQNSFVLLTARSHLNGTLSDFAHT